MLDHCAETSAGICGVEILDVSRWEEDHQVDFLNVVVSPDEGLDWARQLVRGASAGSAICISAEHHRLRDVLYAGGGRGPKTDPNWNREHADLEEALGGIRRYRSGD